MDTDLRDPTRLPGRAKRGSRQAAQLERAKASFEMASELLAAGSIDTLAAVLGRVVGDLLGARAAVFVGGADVGLCLVGSAGGPGDDERFRLAGASTASGRVTITAVEPTFLGGTTPASMGAVPLTTASGTLGSLVVDGAVEPAQLDVLVALGALAAKVIEQIEHARTSAAEARIDPLTGLANKRAFHERLSELLQATRSEGALLSAILFDLDDFKRINDREGHLVGDRVLRNVGRVALSALRADEDIYRLGGEEFAVLLRTDKAAAEHVANRIRGALAAQRRDLSLPTISAGVATAPEDGSSAEELLHKADVALYAAKADGKDRVVLYGPRPEPDEVSDRDEREQQLEAEWWIKVLGTAARARRQDELGPGWSPQDVAHLSELIAAELGVAEGERVAIVLAAVLVELCKLAVPDSIRLKAGRLTPREWSLVRERTERMVAALAPIPHLAEAIPILNGCRERWDGRGPGRLAGEAIPIGARIVAVCEVYCALGRPRSDRPARTQARALLELQELAGTRFDPACVQALRTIVERGTASAA